MHIIQKQIIEFNYPQTARIDEIQADMNGLFDKKLVPLLSSVFDDLSTPNEVLRLDKLFIDLGSFDYPLNEEVLLERFSKI